MTSPPPEHRSPGRRALDERIASEPPLTRPDLPPDAVSMPAESHLAAHRRPIAVAGVVGNGMVRPLDPTVRLPELARVIIVTAPD